MTPLQVVVFFVGLPALLWMVPQVWAAVRDELTDTEVLSEGRWHCFEPGEPCSADDPCSPSCGLVTGTVRSQ